MIGIRSFIFLAVSATALVLLATHDPAPLSQLHTKPPLVSPPPAVSAERKHLETHAEPSPEAHLADSTVTQKYSALLETRSASDQQQLRELLIRREATQQTAMREVADLERRISLLLPGDDYALYEQLRESHGEQAHLNVFAQQVAATAPLTTQQQRALLLAKLKHTHAIQTLELQDESTRANVSAMEQSYSRDIVIQGLTHHATAFLDEVRPALTEEQWLALQQFETATVSTRFPRID